MRSGPADLDLVAYSLRKYVRLALKGHPTILLLPFVPDELVLVRTELALVSRRALHGYLGYLRGQKERLLGTQPRRSSGHRVRPSPSRRRSIASSYRPTGAPGAGG